MTYPSSLPTAALSLARCALLLSLCTGCRDARDAELGIFDLRPGLRNQQPGAAGTTQGSGGSGASSAKLTVELIASLKDFCPGECVDLFAAAGGGRPPYQYTWELDGAGLSGPGPHVVCQQTAPTFSVTVTDADFDQSGFEVGDTVQVVWRADCAALRDAGEPAPPSGTPSSPAPTAPPPAAPPTPIEPPQPTQHNTPAPAANPPNPEPFALTLHSSAASVCRGECVELTASAKGGRAPYQYNWELPNLSGPGPHHVCPTKTTTYAAFAMDADFESNHLEMGATTQVVVNDCTR